MNRYRVYASCDIGEEAFRLLREAGCEVDFHAGPCPVDRTVLLAKIRSGIDGLICSLLDRIDEEVFSAGSKTLKVVSQYAVGVDNIDREAANRHGIPFTHTPDVLTDATAEFALFMLGAVARRLYPSESLVRSGGWKAWHPFHPFLGEEVQGKTVCAVGAGRIGQAFLTKCLGLDVNLIIHSRSDTSSFQRDLQRLMDLRHELGMSGERRTVRSLGFRESLENSDFVSLHVPLTPLTRHLMNEEAIGCMKPGAFLINTARGPVVDEQALVHALRERRIAGAALDVFETEPLPADSPLLAPELQDRVRLFHHFGSGARRTRLSAQPDEGMAGRCVAGLLSVLEGGKPETFRWVVNREVLSLDGK